MAEQNINPRETGDWSVETLFAHLTAVVGEVDHRYEQRFDAQEKGSAETDKRYEQRFVAQEKAVELAISQVRSETDAAMAAADKAITKSESAFERRFESINEFRGQLADQARTFMPRTETVQLATQNAEKIRDLERRMTESLAVINSRLDTSSGRSSGLGDSWGYLIGAIGLAATVIAIILAFNN